MHTYYIILYHDIPYSIITKTEGTPHSCQAAWSATATEPPLPMAGVSPVFVTPGGINALGPKDLRSTGKVLQGFDMKLGLLRKGKHEMG